MTRASAIETFTVPKTHEDLLDALLALDLDIIKIEGQIERHQAGLHDATAPVWEYKVRAALKIKRAQRKRLQDQIDLLKRAKIVHRATVFLDAAQFLFDDDDLKDVWVEVYRRHPELQDEA